METGKGEGGKRGKGEGVCEFITPHAQRERGKVIGRGVHIYIYIYIYMSVDEKNI